MEETIDLVTINYRDTNVDELPYHSVIDDEFQIISLMNDRKIIFLN